MTLTFITNYLTHHTSPLSEALYGWLGAGFRFVETRPLRAGRVELGWQPEQDRPYLLRAYQGPEVAARCRHLALGSDVVLLGSAPDSWILPRLRQNRLTFRYGERWYKTGPPPGARARAWLHHGRFRRAPLYLLCASAYGASDAARAGCYPGRAYRFGYFPQVHFHCKGALLSQKDPTGSTLLWAGRFLSWKHPLTAIALARRLQEAALPFRLTLLGTGPERQAMEREIHRQHLEDQVQILGPQPPAAVRKEMEQANLFLLTSDFQEGWGAVLNEAMSSACAVISSHAAAVHHDLDFIPRSRFSAARKRARCQERSCQENSETLFHNCFLRIIFYLYKLLFQARNGQNRTCPSIRRREPPRWTNPLSLRSRTHP